MICNDKFPKIFTKKCVFTTTLILSLIIFIFQNYLWTLLPTGETKFINYFLDSTEFTTNNLLVNTTTCQIPDIDPFHPTILQFIQPPVQHHCERHGRLTYINETNLVFNLTAIKNWGYSFGTISCCYKTISRVEQTLDNYDSQADSISLLSEKCENVPEVINPMTVEYIKIFCYKKYFQIFYDLIYTNYHAIGQPQKNLQVQNKIKYWQPQEAPPLPPNVIIIGMDSISRMSSERNLKETRKYLKTIGAIEMSGYTKVGENTFPNAVPFMSGYSVEELTKVCYFTPYTAQDACPYIWQQFSLANYLTVFLEDTPVVGNYNYFKTGFVRPPADYYLRPYMQQIYQEKKFIEFGTYQHFTLPCAGPDRPYEKIGTYMHDLYKMAKKLKTPIFINSWQITMAHDDLNDLKGADEYLAQFFRQFDLQGNDTDTILVTMSDHGYRYGSFRETHIGWHEDKLPWFSIYLSPGLRRRYPEWVNALEVNSRRLTSPYDLYHTWAHILDEFTPLGAPTDSKIAGNSTLTIPRKFGQSLFKIISENRTCAQARVANAFCACYNPIKVPLDDAQLIQAAQAAVSFINGGLPWDCVQLKVDKITAGAVGNGIGRGEESVIIVGFTVQPGKFHFEATVNFIKNNNSYQLHDDILRTNSIKKTEVTCVRDAVQERYCYCA